MASSGSFRPSRGRGRGRDLVPDSAEPEVEEGKARPTRRVKPICVRGQEVAEELQIRRIQEAESVGGPSS